MLRLGFSRLGDWTEDMVDAEYPRLLSAYEGAICVHTKLYPGTVAAVETLRKRGFAVAICTNKPKGLAETLLRALGVRDIFGALIGADSLPVRKPHPAPYVAAVTAVGGEVVRSMLVGDTDTDRQTAKAAGVPVALVTFGPEGHAIARLEPEALLHHFDDLPDLAERLIP